MFTRRIRPDIMCGECVNLDNPIAEQAPLPTAGGRANTVITTGENTVLDHLGRRMAFEYMIDFLQLSYIYESAEPGLVIKQPISVINTRSRRGQTTKKKDKNTRPQSVRGFVPAYASQAGYRPVSYQGNNMNEITRRYHRKNHYHWIMKF